MQNAARGVARLKAAAEAVDGREHARVCRELGLASERTDDIPSLAVLRRLVETLESLAQGEKS
jgi:hypothetical protein